MKSNTRNLVLIFGLLLLMVFAVMMLKPKHGGPEVITNQIQVYFTKSRGDDMTLEAVSRPLPTEKTDSALVNAAIVELLEGPSADEKQKGLFTEIPQGTHINSVKELPDKVVVDLNAQYAGGGGANSMVQRYEELSKTLKSLPLKKPVFVTIAGKPLEVLGGEGLEVPKPIAP